MHAIILTGGKQYRVAEGEKIFVEKIEKKAGDEVVFEQVLMVIDGDKTAIGTPTVKDSKVVGEVVKQTRSPKVIVFKRKPKKGYRKKQGHRQDMTEIKVTKIEAGTPAGAA